MSLTIYLFGIGITTLGSLAISIWILFNIDPLIASRLELIIFYTAVALAMMGMVTLLSFYLRLIRSKNEFYYGNLLTSLRQGFLVSCFAVLTLFLRSLHVINLPQIALLFFAFVLFELYFLAKK